MHSECLVTASGDASVEIQFRFLHLLAKQVSRAVEDRFEPVASLVVDGQLIEGWDEGVERAVKFEVALRSRTEACNWVQLSTVLMKQKRCAIERPDRWKRLTRTQDAVSGRMTIASQQTCAKAFGSSLLMLPID